MVNTKSYNNGRIFAVWVDGVSDYTYIGSTTQENLQKRRYVLNFCCKKYKSTHPELKNILSKKDCRIKTIEYFPTTSRAELRERQMYLDYIINSSDLKNKVRQASFNLQNELVSMAPPRKKAVELSLTCVFD